jgi:hypothetical protein
MITDRAFADDSGLRYPALDPTGQRPGVRDAYLAGVLGDVILVNGAPWPVHEVDAARYRLRILNASNAGHYALEAVTDAGRRLELVQIGADQGAARRTGHPPIPADRPSRTLRPGHRRRGGPGRQPRPARQPAGCRSHPRRDGVPRRPQGLRPEPHPPRPLHRPAHLAPLGRHPHARLRFPRRTDGQRSRVADRRAPRATPPAPMSPSGSATSRCGGWSPTSHHPVHLHLVGLPGAVPQRPRAAPPRRRPQGHHLATTGRVGGDHHPLSTATAAASSSTATTPNTRTWA